jgi:hypothetical protein
LVADFSGVAAGTGGVPEPLTGAAVSERPSMPEVGAVSPLAAGVEVSGNFGELV